MNSVMQGLFKWCFLVYLAILPVADTIALRNLLLLLLLLVLLVWGVRVGRQSLDGARLLRWVPVPLLLWCVFLLLFPLWASEPEVALANLKGQSGVALAAWGIGLGAVLMLRQGGPGLWALGLASALLVVLHLLLTAMAWAGLFGVPVPSDLPASQMWGSMASTLAAAPDGAAWKWQSFPWGFRGFDPMHGNLGYTASQAITLFLACYVMAFSEHKASRAWKATLMIVACFFSIAIANSRGAVLYSLFLLLLATSIYLLRFGTGKAGADLFRGRSLHFAGALALLAVALVFFLGQSLSKDARWRTMIDKAYAGFLVADPVEFLCNGLSPQDHVALLRRTSSQDPAYAEQIIQGLNGDGGRTVLMRAGLQLVREHPLGLDGSRQAYEKLMVNKCGHRPVFEFAHAHQAWINLALSLGWAGALLFAGLLCYFALAGARGLGQEEGRSWAFALFLLSIFWILRGFTDAVYQEHYLQMQALLLGYLWGRMRLATGQIF